MSERFSAAFSRSLSSYTIVLPREAVSKRLLKRHWISDTECRVGRMAGADWTHRAGSTNCRLSTSPLIAIKANVNNVGSTTSLQNPDGNRKKQMLSLWFD